MAPDKFKGSLSAAAVAAALARGINSTAPDIDVERVPVADGGEGLVDTFVSAGWQRVSVRAPGPVGEPVDTGYAVRGQAAVIELADVSGLSRIPAGERDPVGSGTEGVGVLIVHALEHGATEITLGLGGSASTDGGAGLLRALGVRILDAHGRAVPRGGGALIHARTVDVSGLHPAVSAARITLALDVDNPLLGEQGAVAVFAPQKGAGPDECAVLAAALENWACVLAGDGVDWSRHPGAGAAGGTGFAALAALAARPRPGIEVVLELLNFPARIAGAGLVVTGEGSLDAQSLHGKAPVGVCATATALGIPVIAVAGRILLDAAQLHRAGFAAAYALSELEPDPVRSMTQAAELLERVGQRIGAGL